MKALTGVEDARSLAVVEDRAFQCSLQRVTGTPHVWLSVVRLHVSQLTLRQPTFRVKCTC